MAKIRDEAVQHDAATIAPLDDGAAGGIVASPAAAPSGSHRVSATAKRPLEGFRVGVTAAMWAERQLSLWRSAGAETEHAAMVGVVALAPQAVDPQVRELVLGDLEVIVFTSRAGVLAVFGSAGRLGLHAELCAKLDRVRIVSTSPEAVAELGVLGFSVDVTIRGSEPDEVRRAMDHPSLRADHVAVVLDGEGNDVWESTFGGAGPQPRLVSVYRWGPPADLDAAELLVGSALRGRLDAVTFISRGAVDQFRSIAEQVDPVGQLASVTAVCLDASCADRAREHGFGEVVCPPRSSLGAMVRTLAEAFSIRSSVIDLRDNRLVIQGHSVHLDGRQLPLSHREFEVLRALAERPGTVVSKSQLVRAVWGTDADVHLAEVSIARLRQRMGSAGAEIETVFRRGYRLRVEAVPSPG
jgi:uroporphyrinogen-III synthase